MLCLAYRVAVFAALSLSLFASKSALALSSAPVVVLAEGVEPIPIPPWASTKAPPTPLVQLAEGVEPIPIPPWAPTLA